MSNDWLYIAEIDTTVDPIDVQSRLTESFGNQVTLSQVRKEVLFRDDAARRLRDIGPSGMLRMAGRLEEAVLKRGESPSVLAALVNDMLRRIGAEAHELIIIDPYFLSISGKTPPDYADIIDQLWNGVLDGAKSLVIITRAKFDEALSSEVSKKAYARNGNIQVSHRHSDAFHDRFWIVDRAKGLFVGTSVNSLGNKYALVDYLQETDVREIIATLKTLDLLT